MLGDEHPPALILIVLAAAHLALVIDGPSYMALLVMEHPREVYRTEVLAAALTVTLILSLVGTLGLLGPLTRPWLATWLG